MTQPILVQKPGKESGDIWQLTGYWDGEKNHTGDWPYLYNYRGYEWKHVIPFKFDKLDGASVPDLIQPIINMGGREMPDQSWLPHDHGYYCMRYYGFMPSGTLFKKVNGAWEEVQKVSRLQLDEVFRNELMKPEHGLASFKPGFAFAGVRAGGGPDWSME